MTDNELKQFLPDYLRGLCDDATAAEIKIRLASSEELRSALEDAQRYIDTLDAIEPDLASDSFLQKVQERIEARQRIFDLFFRPFYIKIPAELAGIAVTVALVIFIFNPFPGKLPREIQRHPMGKDRILQKTPASQVAAGHEALGAESDLAAETEKTMMPEPVEEKTTPQKKPAPEIPKKQQTAKKRKTVHQKRTPAKPAARVKSFPNEAKKEERSAGISPKKDTAPHYPPQSLHRTVPAPAVRAPVMKPAASASDYDADDESDAPENNLVFVEPPSGKRATRAKKARQPKARDFMSISEAEASLPPPPQKLTVKDHTLNKIKRITPKYGAEIDSIMEMNDTFIKLRMTLPDHWVSSFQRTLLKTIKPSLCSLKALPSDGKNVVLLVDIEIIK